MHTRTHSIFTRPFPDESKFAFLRDGISVALGWGSQQGHEADETVFARSTNAAFARASVVESFRQEFCLKLLIVSAGVTLNHISMYSLSLAASC